MAGIILESFAGVVEDDMSTTTEQGLAADKLAGKWTTVNSLCRIVEVEECAALSTEPGFGGFRELRYDLQPDEIDTFLWTGFRAQCDTLTGEGDAFGNILLCGFGDSNGIDIYVAATTSGRIRIVKGSISTYHWESAAGLLTADVPFDIGFECTKHNTNGSFRVFLSGDLLVTVEGVDTLEAGTQFTRVGYSSPSDGGGGLTPNAWIRNIRLGNSLGTRHRSYSGVKAVGVSMPSGNGSSEEFDPGAGAGGNYAVVAEKDVTDGDSYITADTANLEDLYIVAPVEGSGEMGFVQGTARDQKSAGTAYYSIRAALGASNIGSPEIQSETGWGNGRYVFQTKPGGGDWNIGDYDATNFGVRSTTVSGGDLRIEQFYVEYEIDTYTGENCGGSVTPVEIDEFTDNDLPIPSLPGTPDVASRLIDDMWWAHEVPGGFMEGGFRVPLHIQDASDIAHFEDLIVVDPEDDEVLYQGRVEPIQRSSDSQGMWAEYGTAGWVRNALEDQLYWGRLKDLRFAVTPTLGVVTGGYVDTISHELGVDSGGDPLIRVHAPGGTGLGITAGTVYQFEWKTDPYAPNPQIQRIRFHWRASRIVAGARFQIVAYSPVGSLSAPSVIYDEPHSTTSQIVTLYHEDSATDDVALGEPGDAVIPEGTWRLLIRPIAFTAAVGTIPGDGLTVGISSPAYDAVWTIGQMDTIHNLRASDVVKRIIDDACPALSNTTITQSDTLIDNLVYETPTRPADIFNEMLLFTPTDEEWTWYVRERLGPNPTDKYRFYFGPLPTEASVRYEVTGVEIRPLTYDVRNLANRAIVKYTDHAGRPETVAGTQSVAELTAIGLTRTRFLDAGTLRGLSVAATSANASVIADALLAESAEPEQAGQFRVIGTQVEDNGTPIPFYKIKPGELIRINDTDQGDPAAAVWRIRRVEVHLGTRMEAIISVGKGSSSLNALLARLQQPQF